MELESKNNGMFGRKKSPTYYAFGILACVAILVICLIPQPNQSMLNLLFVKIFVAAVALLCIAFNVHQLTKLRAD